MANAPRHFPLPDQPDDREAGIETLLLTGLDSYFAGDYERAIHAWERVLFLDRGHARAKAYIDRARAIVAERQRECDARLQEGIDAFEEGDPARARTLLASVLRERGQDDQALALLKRLERLEGRAVVGGPALPPVGPVRAVVVAAPRPGRYVNRVLIGATALLLCAAAVVVLGWRELEGWRPSTARNAGGVTRPLARQAPSPDPGLAALERARTLAARGHLHEALRALDTVTSPGARRVEVDGLRTEWQRALLDAYEAGRSTRPTPAVPDARP